MALLGASSYTNSLTLLSQSAALASCRIENKIKPAYLTYTTLTTSTTTTTTTTFNHYYPYIPPRSLRFLGMGLLVKARYSTVTGSCAFHVAALKEWTRLPIFF